MKHPDYRNHLYAMWRFHVSVNPQPREEPDFPWALLRKPKFGLRGQLRRLPLIRRMCDSEDARDADWANIERNIEPLFTARSLFDDELSRVLFDATIILRAVSHRKYYYPKPLLPAIAEVKASERFASADLPTSYLGLPLYRYDLNVQTSAALLPTRVIAPAGFVEGLNSYRQYVLTRDSVPFGPSPTDTVMDCGCCIGDFSVIFAALVGASGRVHAFDPVPLHTRICEQQAKLNPSLAAVFKFNGLALGRSPEIVGSGEASDCAEIHPGGLGVGSFEITTLDDYAASNRLDTVDYVKMDIEGAECDALHGAKECIREFKPKLAISSYHRPDDFWAIPLLIKELNPGYKVAFAHHSPVNWESVVYARPN